MPSFHQLSHHCHITSSTSFSTPPTGCTHIVVQQTHPTSRPVATGTLVHTTCHPSNHSRQPPCPSCTAPPVTAHIHTSHIAYDVAADSPLVILYQQLQLYLSPYHAHIHMHSICCGPATTPLTAPWNLYFCDHSSWVAALAPSSASCILHRTSPGHSYLRDSGEPGVMHEAQG
jgi:hypothetical protein